MKHICKLSALIIPAVLAGCGGGGIDPGSLGTLSGTVSFEGTPLAEGSVVLTGTDGKGGGADIGPDGTYTVTSHLGGIPVGTYQVSFMPAMVEVSMGENSPPAEQPKDMPNMPAKYRDASTSGLTVEISEGSNTKDFDLVP